MSLAAISLEPMQPAHLGDARRLSAAVGWPHRAEDWRFMLALGQGLVALEDGRAIGTIAWWPFGPDYASLGMVIVDPERQGRGLGRRLMEAALSGIGSRNILLTATEAGLPLYEKLGFRPLRNLRQHQGVAQTAGLDPVPLAGTVRALRADDVAAIASLDANASGLARSPLLQALREAGEALVLEGDDGLAGYAFCRRFGRGLVIGPVAASSTDAAKCLIAAWFARNGPVFQRIDTPVQAELSDWLATLGLPCCDEVLTMVRGAPPKAQPVVAQLFAVTSQALG